MAGRLACPKRTHATGLRAPLRSSKPALHSGSQKFRHSTELDGATRAVLNSPLKDCEPNAALVARRLAHTTRACRRRPAFATVSAMPPALAKAHAGLDRAVDLCYRPEKFDTDRQRVEYLFALYEKLTAPLLPVAKSKRTRRGGEGKIRP